MSRTRSVAPATRSSSSPFYRRSIATVFVGLCALGRRRLGEPATSHLVPNPGMVLRAIPGFSAGWAVASCLGAGRRRARRTAPDTRCVRMRAAASLVDANPGTIPIAKRLSFRSDARLANFADAVPTTWGANLKRVCLKLFLHSDLGYAPGCTSRKGRKPAHL